MICFKDMTFCSAKCLTRECHRHWSEDKSRAARALWGSDEAPVAFSDFSDGCPDYKPEGE